MDNDKASRSVFVGNIPYEATEETLRQIFGEIGHVRSFRLVTDKETGKPKGYGFVEYSDRATAASAIRNLQGREVFGRNLRVDSASQDGLTGGKDRNTGMNAPNNAYETQQAHNASIAAVKREADNRMDTSGGRSGSRSNPQSGKDVVKDEGKYGDPVVPKEAPESISHAVASLPPEQMFQLMKEMKECITNNPHEARNMLLQNPQLAYALLQAQVVMRIVDPEIAMKMLHRQAPVQPLVVGGVRAQPVPRPKANTASNYLSKNTQAAQNATQQVKQPARPTSKREAPAIDGNDREKAQLIMQVMNLTEEQINMLPLEQRRSILELRAQLASQTGGR